MGLLGYELSSLAPSLALSLLHNKAVATRPSLLTADQLAVLLTPYDVKVIHYLFFSFPLASCFRRYLSYVLELLVSPLSPHNLCSPFAPSSFSSRPFLPLVPASSSCSSPCLVVSPFLLFSLASLNQGTILSAFNRSSLPPL